MPNLDFYAVGGDRDAVLEAVYRDGRFRVFEAYSEVERELREFASAADVPDVVAARHLMLYAVGSGPEPIVQRLILRAGAVPGATYRYRCQGWGLVQLHFADPPRAGDFSLSRTTCNTEARARAWADVYPALGDPGAWDWAAVTRAARRLNRRIRSMAVGKVGSHPVLPAAAEHIERAGLRFEYGHGLHARPAARQPV